MGSFNAHCVRKATYGGSTPIWLGVVTPLPAGGVLASGFVKEKTLIPAGSPIKFDSGTITPLLFAEVVSSTSGSPNDTIVVKKPLYGQFAVGDLIQKVGATFATTGKAAAIVSVAENASDKGNLDITVASGSLDSLSKGDVISLSAASTAGSGKSLKTQPNAYLYNDIYIDYAETGSHATGSAVEAHAEGILINQSPSRAVATQMAAAVPLVVQAKN
jgi:hypothetical protein